MKKVTVEQYLRDIGLLGGGAAPEAPEAVEVLINLAERIPVQINGSLQWLEKGEQYISENIYNVLKDANLI
jgi:hypothetical protein